MKDYSLVTYQLVKEFHSRNNFRALDGISLTIKKNEIMGLLGQNGAGKTTFISILIGLIESDYGDFYINGFSGSE